MTVATITYTVLNIFTQEPMVGLVVYISHGIPQTTHVYTTDANGEFTFTTDCGVSWTRIYKPYSIK